MRSAEATERLEHKRNPIVGADRFAPPSSPAPAGGNSSNSIPKSTCSFPCCALCACQIVSLDIVPEERACVFIERTIILVLEVLEN